MKFYVRVEGKCLYRQVPLQQFLDEWAKSYSSDHDLEIEYRESIGWKGTELAPLTEKHLERIWKWKSGGQWGRDQIIRSKKRLERFNEFRQASESDPGNYWEDVASEVSKSGFIYQAFAFHIARPQDYPIVDRHVLRAYICICGVPSTVVIDPPGAQANCWSSKAWDKRYKPYQIFWRRLMKELTGFSKYNVEHNRRLDTAIRNFGVQLLEDYRPSNEFELQVV